MGDGRDKRLITVALLAAGAVLWPVLAVYPFDYGPVESAVFVGVLLLLGFYQLVLDDALVAED